MAFSTFWAMITSGPGRPGPWRAWRSLPCRNWEFPTLTPRAPEQHASRYNPMSNHHHTDEAPPGNGRHGTLLERLSHFLRRGHGHAMRDSLEEVIEESDR